MLLSYDEIKEILPTTIGKNLHPEAVLQLTRDMGSTEAVEAFRDNALGYRNVLEKGKFSAAEYFAAVKFMTYRAMGHNNRECYELTFPDRVERLKKDRKYGNVNAYVHAYTRSRLIELMTRQFSVPLYLLYHDRAHEAIETLATIMVDQKANTMARVKAADSLLAHLAPPVDTKLDVQVSVKQTDEFDAIIGNIADIAKHQRTSIGDGRSTAKEIAEARIVSEVHDV